MSQPFKSVDLTLPELDLTRIQGGAFFEGYGEVFRAWEILDIDYLLSQVHSQIRFRVPPLKITYVEITGSGAEPHSEEHTVISTVLNYYIETGRDVTQFWNCPNPETSGRVSILNDQGYNPSTVKNYTMSQLEHIGSFVAQPKSAWILDVTRIHSVLKPRIHSVRKFIRFSWSNLSVEQVFDNIEFIHSQN